MTQNPKLQVGLTGHFALNIYNPETGEHRQYEFDNIITNGGMDRLGSASGSIGSVINYVQVGTGSTAPAVTNSSLANYLVGTSRSLNYSVSYGGSPTFHTEGIFTWQFDQGVAAGNLSEIGVGWALNGSLFSRALILDGNGNPTTITVTSIEFLTVTYKLRMYPPTTDVTGTITLDGSNYNYIVRASEAGGSSWYSHGQGGYGSGPVSNLVAYTGDIGSVTYRPSGSSSSFNSASVAAYSSGSYKRTFIYGANINNANLTGGIRSIAFSFSNSSGFPQMQWQCQFDPKIPKDNTKTLSLTFEVSWARKT